MDQTPVVTVDSIRRTLDYQGAKCPINSCGCEQIRVEVQLGNDECPSQEFFTCQDCGTKWDVYLYAAKVENITFPGEAHPSWAWQSDKRFEERSLDQMAVPKGPLAEALKEFIRELKLGSVEGKARALASLAHMARIDLTQLPGNSLEERQALPSEEQ